MVRRGHEQVHALEVALVRRRVQPGLVPEPSNLRAAELLSLDLLLSMTKKDPCKGAPISAPVPMTLQEQRNMPPSAV